MVCPYSLRVTPDATVSTPLEWADVKKGIKPAAFNLFSVVKFENDPWKDILENRQKLEVK
jgi:bifunctional non-homologous end joining protein LigD